MDDAVADRARFHHIGNVRGGLLDAARQILNQQGRGHLSLRAIAARTGVAAATVYYHYRNKDALLAALAVEGFSALSQAMAQADAARGEHTGLRATGLAYLGFVQAQPALYALMYEVRDQARSPEVAVAEEAAFAVMRGAIGRDGVSRYPPGTADNVSATIWACGRGIAAIALARGGQDGAQSIQQALRGLEFLITRRFSGE